MNIEAILQDTGMTHADVKKFSMETMCDGNPSIYHNPFAGDKIRYGIADTVMATKYHTHPDTCLIVIGMMGDVLKTQDIETEEVIFIRKDGVSPVNLDSAEDVAKIKTRKESEEFYGPRREERQATIELAILLAKL